ncbi:MAG TPA: hypothetical protein VN963_00080, partial [bacterium]|nr:hypothetical protein [bacterium]
MKAISFLVGIGFFGVTFGANPVMLPFSEGQTLAVNLSDTNINRISVDNDKILHLTCEPGA